MRSLAVLMAKSVREVLGGQPIRLPQLRAAAWGQTHQGPGRPEAMNARERGDAWRGGTPGGPGTLCGLGPVQVEPLTRDVGTWPAVKSKRQDPRVVVPAFWDGAGNAFLGGAGCGGWGREEAGTGPPLGRSCHLAHAIRVIFGVPLSARNHPPFCSSCPTCLQAAKRNPVTSQTTG